jgi:hypothetical protein
MAVAGLARALEGAPAAAFLVAVMAVTVVLVGPGAFSIDARLFGRREIVVLRASAGRPPETERGTLLNVHCGAVPPRAIMKKLLALLFLSVSCGDLALDAGCDPLPIQAGPVSAVVEAPTAPESGEDRCATVCVPDCFCCSRTLVRGQVVPPAAARRVTAAPEAAPLPVPGGVRPVPYHPPLAQA